MRTISQMAEKCQKCPDRDKCNHKQMEICAYIEMPKNDVISNAVPNGIYDTSINAGYAFTINREKLEKKIEQSLIKRFSIGREW